MQMSFLIAYGIAIGNIIKDGNNDFRSIYVKA